MKTYVVGGAVRDRLLGLPVIDRDHVVVGATVDEMLAAGFRPVGRDFPVFLHPQTHEEYALARTERKVAPGYAGFVFHADPTVTLEADLERRDLTINAIAEVEASGMLIDPFDGRRDLALKVFRHVGPAFVEDPVRVLRIARFAARLTDFTVAPDTLALMRAMAAGGEIDALVPERVWQEIARGLVERRPSRMIETLRDAHALAPILPEVDALFDGRKPTAGLRTLRSLDRAAARDAGEEAVVEVRFAVLVHAVDEPSNGTRHDEKTGGPRPSIVEPLCKRLGVPRAVRDLAMLVARERPLLIAKGWSPSSAGALVDAMERSDAFRRAPRFAQAIDAMACTIDDPRDALRLTTTLTAAFDAATTVDAGAIAKAVGYDPTSIASRVRRERVAMVEASLANTDEPPDPEDR